MATETETRTAPDAEPETPAAPESSAPPKAKGPTAAEMMAQLEAVRKQNAEMAAALKAEREERATERAEAARAVAVQKIQADASAFHRDLTDGKAPRLVGKLAQDARTLYEAAAQHDLDHPPADGKPGLSAQLRDFCLSLPPIDTAEHGDSTPEDAEDRGDGTRTLSHRTETPGTNGPLSEADFKAALASTPEGKALLSDAGKYAGHLAEMRAAGLVK